MTYKHTQYSEGYGGYSATLVLFVTKQGTIAKFAVTDLPTVDTVEFILTNAKAGPFNPALYAPPTTPTRPCIVQNVTSSTMMPVREKLLDLTYSMVDALYLTYLLFLLFV